MCAANCRNLSVAAFVGQGTRFAIGDLESAAEMRNSRAEPEAISGLEAGGLQAPLSC